MKLKIPLPGIGTVEIDGDEETTIIAQAAFWTELPEACPICGATLRLSHRKPKGFTYYGLVCKGSPEHECNFGQKKEDGSLYYKGPASWRLSPGAGCEDDLNDDTPTEPGITQEQLRTARTLCRDQGLIADRAAGKMFEGLALEELTQTQADELIKALEARAKKKVS